jgi:hypothetical protein
MCEPDVRVSARSVPEEWPFKFRSEKCPGLGHGDLCEFQNYPRTWYTKKSSIPVLILLLFVFLADLIVSSLATHCGLKKKNQGKDYIKEKQMKYAIT